MNGVISSRTYNPGDLIYSEDAFAKSLLRKNKEMMCEWCCKRPLWSLKTCKPCMAVKYCGKECQKNDWPTHRLECKYMKNLPQNETANFVRFIGKVLLKIKDSDWKLIKRRVLGKDFTFEDVDSYDAEFSKNPKMIFFFKELKELLIKYIGVENLPDDERLMKVMGKVKFNSLKEPMFFFCLGMSKFDEECIPNSNMCISGNEVKVWACKKIRKGDKISFPKRCILTKTELVDGNQSPCKCRDCSLPYGESLLTKVIDEKRAYSVIEESETVLLASSLLPVTYWDRAVIENLLKKQKEVLGHTNHLHLKLLALKCLEFGEHPLVVKDSLMELERDMKSVFGDYYYEMEQIYLALGRANCQLGNLVIASDYWQKAKRIIEYRISA